MRKSFTWFLSLLVFLFVFAASTMAQEPQETVELYADDASGCYKEANDYTVSIAVRDFIKLTQFDLDLQYNDAVFEFTGASGVNSLLSTMTITEAAGVINLAWNGGPATIGNDLKTEILKLHFKVLGFPGNTATSFTSDMGWTTADFWYTTSENVKDAVNTVKATDGSLAVNVELTGIETTFTTETCAGGDVTVKVTAPPASKYLFNEDPIVANWEWTTSASYLVKAGEVVTIRVKDASGCMSLVDIVDVPETVDPVAFTVETQDPTCYGGKGSVVINATGGNAPYKYYITTDTTVVTPDKGNFQFSMAPGTYYVNVQDANGCAKLPWQQITITDNNPTLEVGATPTDVLCYGESTGSIATSVVQGDLTMVSLNGVVWETLPYTFTDLAAGTYTVYAKNEVGCTVELKNVKIAQPAAPITFSILIDDTSCGGGVDDGAITVQNVTGGTAPYEYSLDGETWTTDTVFTGLAPTYYSLWVRDDNGCTVAYDNPNGTGNVIAVQSPEDIMYEVNVTDPACNNQNALIEIVNVTGGTGSYIYSFDGGATWGEETSMEWPAPYNTVTVSVANPDSSCAVNWVVEEVNNPEPLAVAAYDELAPTCIDGNDGNVTLEITGGTPPYYYKVNESSWKMTEDIYTHVRLNVGTHTIQVKDANDCEYETEIEVTISLDENNIVATKDGHIDCFGDKTGTINVVFNSWAEGLNEDAPNRNVEYYIENSAGVVTSFTPSNQGGTPTTFGAGIYTVWVVDQYTCESNKDTVLVTENPELLISSVVSNAASCFESFEGTITIYATGGNTDALEYAVVNNEGALGNITDDKWLPFDTYTNLVNPPLSTVSFNVDGGTYWIAVRDDGCDEKTYGPIVVQGYEKLLVDEEQIDWTDPLCNGDYNGTITVPMSAVSGGAGAYRFTLLVSEGEGGWTEYDEDYTNLPTGQFTGLPEGIYAVLVEDAENCPSYTTGPIELNEPDVLSFNIDYLHIRCEGTNDGVITINAYGGTPDYWYAINNTNTWVAFGAGKTEKTYIATEPGTFTIWVKDANGCVTEASEVTIMEPTALSADIEVSSVSCNAGSDGSISMVGTGGWEEMTVYAFKVDDGLWTTATSIGGLAAGTHTLYIKDVNNYSGNYQNLDCEYSLPFTVTEPTAITYDVILTDVSCKDGADGTFTVNVLSGGTPYVDLVGDWDGYDIRLTGDNYDSGWKRTGIDYSETFTGLAHSMYTVYIKDANGCQLKPTVGDKVPTYITVESWEVAEPDTYLNFEAMWKKDASCYGSEDGEIEINATGGNPPYKYYAGLSIPPEGGGHILVPAPDPDSDEWSDSNILKRGAGTWVVWVMDANGCIKGGETDENGVPVNEWRVKIKQPTQVVWDWVWKGYEPQYKDYLRPSCFGTWDGEIPLAKVGGGSGVYNAHVWGVSADGEPVDLWYTDIAEEGFVLGGVPASDASGLWVTVTDDNGCTSEEDTIVINQPAPLTVTLQESPDNYSCFGAVEGWIEAYATGGNEDIPGMVREYQLLKDGVVHTPWQSIASAFLVQVGHEFVVQVRDIVPGRQTCTTESDVLWMPTPLKVEYTYEDLTCYGAEKPTVKINATGTPGREFKVYYRQVEDNTDPTFTEYNGWFTESIIINDAFSYDNENFNDLHYAVYVVDDHGCLSPIDTLTFDQVQVPLTVNIEKSNLTECTEDVTIKSVVGGVEPYVMMIDGDVITEMTATLARGMHTVKVTDGHMCSIEEMVEVAGMYVTRDTTIETYIGEKTAFVDAEAGIDTMLAVGSYTWVYTLECERTLNVEVVEVPRPYTIAEVQGEGDASPVIDKIAKVTGTVTGISASEGFFVQDAVAANSGIWIEYSAVNDLGLAVGDGVSVVGTVAEIANVTSIQATEVMMAEGTPAITPIEVTPTGVEAEMYESVLVMVPGARATAALSNGEWDIYYETTDNATVNDWLYSSTPVEGNFYNVTGIVNGRLDAFMLEPRMASDVVDITATKVDPDVVNTFKVYPNPFNDKITIDNSDKLSRVVISNIAGQKVIDIEHPTREIRTANLVSGIYVISLYTENGIAKTERMIKR